MSYISKAVAAIVSLLVMALVASRQLFLFTNPQGLLESQGGRYHLWLAIIAAVIACVAGTLMFYFFARRDRNELSQPRTVPVAPVTNYPIANSLARAPFDAKRWALLNPWLSGSARRQKPNARQ